MKPEIINKLHPNDKMELLKKMHIHKTKAQDEQGYGDGRSDSQLEKINAAYKNIQGML